MNVSIRNTKAEIMAALSELAEQHRDLQSELTACNLDLTIEVDRLNTLVDGLLAGGEELRAELEESENMIEPSTKTASPPRVVYVPQAALRLRTILAKVGEDLTLGLGKASDGAYVLQKGQSKTEVRRLYDVRAFVEGAEARPQDFASWFKSA